MLSRRLQNTILLVLAIVFAGLELAGNFPQVLPFTEPIDLALRDALTRQRGRMPSDQIVIVAIDDFSFNWTGYRWPWPRDYIARLVESISAGNPAVIGLDILLFEAEPANDPSLRQALENAPATVGVVQIFRETYTETLQQPVAALRPAFDGLGITELTLDDDAVVRAVPAFDTFSGQPFYHWGFHLASQYLQTDLPKIRGGKLFFDEQTVPLVQGQMLISYHGPAGSYPTYSAASVVEGDVLTQNPDAFRGKIVLIGATSATLQDIYPTPYSRRNRTAGVEIIANLTQTILENDYLRVLPPWASLLIICGMAVLAGFLLNQRSTIVTLLSMAGAIIAWLILAWLALRLGNLYLPLANPLLTLILGVLLPTTGQTVSQELEKRRLRSLFSRFVAPEMVDRLLASSDLHSLNKRATLTILFSDIRGFTTLSERLTPEEVVALLNPYLAEMTAIIHAHGGTVDKYEGDAIVAFFGEPEPFPDHAHRAIAASIAMLRRLDELRARWQAENRLPDHPFQMGIGLNTGEVFVGLLGSEQRINYTIIGDNANLAARIQDLTKTYKWPLLISENTLQAIGDTFLTEYVDAPVVKGKSVPVKIYRVLGYKDDPPEKYLRPLDL